jgi:peptidoglycan/xylan/chitin deacetylase (PgdA/CDA1 family)
LPEFTIVLSWGHPYLTSLDYPAIVAQMTQLEDAFMQVLGFYPTYMRPPFLAFNGLVLSAMGDLGYHVISASIDTKDYENDHPDLISRSFEKFRNELNSGGSIILSHDVHEQTVYTLTRAMLEEIRARGLQAVTVGECLGDPEAFWYRTSR